MFTERLHTLMAALSLSPIALSKEIGCDRSNIDRICKGTRIPRRDGKSAERIVEALYSCADDAGKTGVLLQTISCEKAADADEIREALMGWLFEGEEKASPVKKSARTQHSFHAFGQRLNAVMELTALSNSRLGKLLLYSDQNMDWMVADSFFRAQWATLMAMCVCGGTEIHIIHNVDRDLYEMSAAIRSWLPLYPSGRIRSYYSRILGGGRNDRFRCRSGGTVKVL